MGLLSLAGAGLAWMVVRTATVYALVDLNPYAVSRVAPDDPRVAMNIALADFMIRNGAVDERARSRAYQALAKQPLSETPMLLAAVQALAAGDMKKGEALLVEARHRDPRFVFARLLLLDRYLRTNRIAAAGEEIAILTRLLPQAGELLVPQLARMAARPDTGPALMGILGRDPQLQQDVLSKLAATASPEVVLRAAASVRQRSGAAPDWQGLLLSRLTGSGDFARAYSLWRSFSGVGGTGGEKNVYDGRFQGLPGGPPFNWQLSASAAGVAERASGGLQVQYFGRESAELASQVLLLRPGTYRLQVQAEGNASGEGAQLVWSLACAQSAARLVDLPLTKVSSAARAFAARFTVPSAGCTAQWLRLSGVAADFPGEQDALVREVRIERAGG